MLRKEVGQDCYGGSDDYAVNTKKPDWFNKDKIVRSFDTRPMLAQGEHPVDLVISDLKKLEEREIYEMIASFMPVPLIEKADSLGFEHYATDNVGFIKVYFGKKY